MKIWIKGLHERTNDKGGHETRRGPGAFRFPDDVAKELLEAGEAYPVDDENEPIIPDPPPEPEPEPEPDPFPEPAEGAMHVDEPDEEPDNG